MTNNNIPVEVLVLLADIVFFHGVPRRASEKATRGGLWGGKIRSLTLGAQGLIAICSLVEEVQSEGQRPKMLCHWANSGCLCPVQAA